MKDGVRSEGMTVNMNKTEGIKRQAVKTVYISGLWLFLGVSVVQCRAAVDPRYWRNVV